MALSAAWRLVPALGVAQIVSWGTLYYAISVLGPGMRADLGLGEAGLYGAFAASLLLSGLVAPMAGRAIDRHGGRVVLSAGSLVAALALHAIAQASSPVALYGAWALAGIAMALTLYEPAFATLSQHTGAGYRNALTGLTLLGGLASTVFWPASWIGLERLGWRGTLELFAFFELALCLPLHLLCIPRWPAHRRPAARPRGEGRRRARPRGFWLLAGALSLNAFIVSAIAVHLIGVLQARGFVLATAVWIASFIGPMQVAGRAAEFVVARRLPSRTSGLICLGSMIVAMLLLLHEGTSVASGLAFAALYGASNGVLTIVRGMVPAELFGRERYGELLGDLAAPSLVARAIAPLVCAPLASTEVLARGWLWLLLGLAVLSAGGFAYAVAAPRKLQR